MHAPPARCHNENIARVLPAIEPPVHDAAIRESPQAERDSNHGQSDDNDSAGNVFGTNQVKRARKQQPRSEARLNTQTLLVQKARKSHRVVKVQPPAGHDEANGEPA